MIDSCRGDKAKEAIVEDHYVSAVTRIQLLNGQSITGCCGEIKTQYYVFKLSSKESGDAQNIIVGRHCGEKFLSLIGASKPKLFNPLKSEARNESLVSPKDGQSRGSTTSDQSTERMSALNAQVYSAINLLIMAWDGSCSGILAKMLEYINEHPEKDTQLWALKALNKIIAKDFRSRTMPQMIAQLRNKNPTLRRYEFDEIIKVLALDGESTYLFELKNKQR